MAMSVENPSYRNDAGKVYTFVSGKGGVGKTVITATTAFLLIKAGQRAVVVDCDFATRGLSLYLLGREIYDGSHLELSRDNCLADVLLQGGKPSEIRPRQVHRGSEIYNIVFSNYDVWRGGKPSLGVNSLEWMADGDIPEIDVKSYLLFLTELCDRLKKEYAYVLLDTRGGADPTSGVPAAIADGYIIVVEADQIAVDQVFGLTTAIDQLGARFEIQPALLGYIINKTPVSPDDPTISNALIGLYGGSSFGAIPLDREVPRAYQRKNIPTDVSPSSDFAYFSLLATERLFAPSLNWPADVALRFDRLSQQIKAAWRLRRLIERVQLTSGPLVLVVGLCVIMVFALHRILPALVSSTFVYFLWSTATVLVVALAGIFSISALARQSPRILRVSFQGTRNAICPSCGSFIHRLLSRPARVHVAKWREAIV
jgi:cellulose biosynthesis protein BcsQ